MKGLNTEQTDRRHAMTTTTDTAALYADYVRAEGYAPGFEVVDEAGNRRREYTDAQGNVAFKREGLTFILFASPDDSTYLRLLCPNIWKVEGNATRIHNTISALNANVKVAKAFIVGDQVSLAAETLLETPDGFTIILPRLLSILTFARQAFQGQMVAPAGAQ
jgi:hypothetical protein